jgi:hypothetical protein
VNEIIDNAEMHGGYPFASLNHVLMWKKKLMRPKDILHIKLIEKYQKNEYDNLVISSSQEIRHSSN